MTTDIFHRLLRLTKTDITAMFFSDKLISSPIRRTQDNKCSHYSGCRVAQLKFFEFSYILSAPEASPASTI